MIGEGKARPAVVVGVWNTRQRLRDYMPAKVAARLPARYREALEKRYEGSPLSDEYVRFLVSELKPWVDRSFRTLPDRQNTFIAGSSMGGLVSLYAVTEYPEVFGGAAAISTHWPLFLTWPVEPRPEPEAAAVRAAIVGWLGEALPPPGRVRLYFDHGSESLDALYQPYQLAVDEVVRARGYKAGCDWTSVRFPGTAHDESVWRARADQPLAFLLGPRPQAPDCTTRGSRPD
jgi:enterochelin esterase-like enzyme